MSVSLPIPETIPQLYVVLFRGQVPPPAELDEAMQAWMRGHLQGWLSHWVVRFVDGLVRTEVARLDEIPVPPLEMLRFLGLGAEEEGALRTAESALVVSGADVPVRPRAGFWATQCAARAIAEHVDGIILDPDQRRIRPMDERAEAPPEDGRLALAHHIVVPASRRPEGDHWLTTLGMNRFGLPNLEIVGVPWGLVDEARQLLQAVAQALVEGMEGHAEAQAPMELDDLRLTATTFGRAVGHDVQSAGSVAVSLTRMAQSQHEPLLRVQPPNGETDVGRWLVHAADAVLAV